MRSGATCARKSARCRGSHEGSRTRANRESSNCKATRTAGGPSLLCGAKGMLDASWAPLDEEVPCGGLIALVPGCSDDDGAHARCKAMA